MSIMGLFMLTLGLVGVYSVTTFGPKLSLQNKIKKMLLYGRILPA